MTTRADLIETVEEIIRSWYWTGDTYTNAERAEEVLDAVLPQITTAEQLEALRRGGATVLDETGGAWSFAGEKFDGQWWILWKNQHGVWAKSAELVRHSPLTVVWQPQPEQEPT